MDEKTEYDSLSYRYIEADRYDLIKDICRIPFSEYRPEDEYGARAFDTAFELKELGAIMAVYVPSDFMLKHLIETTENEDDFTERSLKQTYLFLDEHPEAVKKWFYIDGFNVMGTDDDYYGKSKYIKGTRLLCARLDPSRFECSILRIGKAHTGRISSDEMDIGIELRYRNDGRWSLFGYVPNKSKYPYRYILASNVKTTKWPCICGSRVVTSMHMMPLTATVATLQDVNRRKTPA